MTTLADLAALPGSYLQFRCEPCPWPRSYEPSDLIATYSPEMTVANLRKRLTCWRCKMPVDGVYRTLEARWVEPSPG